MRLSTANQISEKLNIPRQRIYELCREGLIPHARIGKRQIRFDPEAIDAWVKAGGTRTTSQKSQDAIPIRSLA